MDGFSLDEPTSSELSLESKPLNLLSPRMLPPRFDFFSAGAPCVFPGPNEKLPNAPIGEKFEPWDAGAQAPAVTGFVALRFRDPNGELVSAAPSRVEESPSLFSSLLSSRKSVFRRKRAAGGFEVFGSSRKKREPPDGDMGFPEESAVSRRLVAGRFEVGDDALKLLR
jgi:hypothetical protein